MMTQVLKLMLALYCYPNPLLEYEGTYFPDDTSGLS